MKKTLFGIVLISGIVLGISMGVFFFLSGKEALPKLKKICNRISGKS